MPKKRRSHSAQFKFKVVLEALQGVKTINQITSKYELNPVQVTQWKKQFLQNGQDVFSKGPDKSQQEFDKERNQMEQKIGQLALSVDFLKKKVDPLFDPRQIEDD